MKSCITAILQSFASPGHLLQLSPQLFPDSSGINCHNLAVGTGNPSLLHFPGVAVSKNQMSSEVKVSHFSTATYSVLLNQHTEYCSWTG